MNPKDIEDFNVVPGYLNVYYPDEAGNMQVQLYSFNKVEDWAKRSGKLIHIHTQYESGVPVGVSEKNITFETYITFNIILSDVREFVEWENARPPIDTTKRYWSGVKTTDK